MTSLTSAKAVSMAAFAVSLQSHAAPLLSESFETAESISTWLGEPSWTESGGNPGGAVVVSNNVQPTNKNFTVDIPLDLTEATDFTITFDALSLRNLAGVFHFYAEPEGFPQYFINFNVEVLINDQTWTPLEFVVEDVPASATFMTLRFEMITGAVIDADVAIAIDNLTVTGPDVDPEGTWKGYPLVDGFWVQNSGQLGWVNVQYDPWLYSASLDGWIYLPEEAALGEIGAWVFIPVF